MRNSTLFKISSTLPILLPLQGALVEVAVVTLEVVEAEVQEMIGILLQIASPHRRKLLPILHKNGRMQAQNSVTATKSSWMKRKRHSTSSMAEPRRSQILRSTSTKRESLHWGRSSQNR